MAKIPTYSMSGRIYFSKTVLKSVSIFHMTLIQKQLLSRCCVGLTRSEAIVQQAFQSTRLVVPDWWDCFFLKIPHLGRATLQETNISPKNGILKMIFLFPRWDMLIPWRVIISIPQSFTPSNPANPQEHPSDHLPLLAEFEL